MATMLAAVLRVSRTYSILALVGRHSGRSEQTHFQSHEELLDKALRA